MNLIVFYLIFKILLYRLNLQVNIVNFTILAEKYYLNVFLHRIFIILEFEYNEDIYKNFDTLIKINFSIDFPIQYLQ